MVISILVSETRYPLPVNVLTLMAGVTAIVWILVFLFVPETSQLTLEQIDDHFLSGRKAWRTSTSRNKRIAKGLVVDHTGEREYKDKMGQALEVDSHP